MDNIDHFIKITYYKKNHWTSLFFNFFPLLFVSLIASTFLYFDKILVSLKMFIFSD